MGVYTANRTSIGGIDPETIVANENYYGAVGAEQILIESYQNDMAIFEAVLANDFAEAVAVNEGTLLESELTAITEASVGSMIDKVKEFLKKVWEKIKGLFHTFMAKLNNVVIRDNKKFVDKYKAEVLKKDLSKLTYKWSERNSNSISFQKADQIGDLANDGDMDRITKLNEKIDSGDYVEEKLAATIGGTSTSLSEYAKDAHEYLFETEEDVDGLGQSRLTDIISMLTTASKALKDLEKDRKSMDDAFAKKLKALDKVRNDLIKNVPEKEKLSDDEKKKRDYALAHANTNYNLAQAFQTVATKASTASIDAVKFEIKQARTVFAKAAAFNPKSVKEDAVLVEAAGEAAEYEVDALFA